ncbi:MAG: putative 2OG-Fe(II) oxygenase [Pseudomonadota bacterium]
MSESGIVGIFPTPVMLAKGVIPPPLVQAMIDQFESSETGANVRTTTLSHTPMDSPRSHENYMAVLKHVAPKLREYGEALMGEVLDWGVKEIWINKMEPGGAQKMHNHANSFISGIIYLTGFDPSAGHGRSGCCKGRSCSVCSRSASRRWTG